MLSLDKENRVMGTVRYISALLGARPEVVRDYVRRKQIRTDKVYGKGNQKIIDLAQYAEHLRADGYGDAAERLESAAQEFRSQVSA